MNKIPMKGASAKAPKMGRFRVDEGGKSRKAGKTAWTFGGAGDRFKMKRTP